MRAGKSLSLSATDICLLKALVQDRNRPQKHVWRGEIVLLTADGVGTNEIMRRTWKSKTCVWRWQERFTDERVRWMTHDYERHGTTTLLRSRTLRPTPSSSRRSSLRETSACATKPPKWSSSSP
jgi:hypothetical protein